MKSSFVAILIAKTTFSLAKLITILLFKFQFLPFKSTLLMIKSYVRWFPTLPYRARLLVARPSETELSLGHPWRIIDDGDLFVIDDDDKGEKKCHCW